MATKTDYYELLGVARGASEADIKKAYRKKAMELHPDRNRDDPRAETHFKEVNEAYDVLKDGQKKAAYDRFGHAAFENGGGGGFRPGMKFGKTDDFGYEVVDEGIHVHDLHATILHLLGLDHENLTFRYSGRDFRLTDIYGNVVEEILA